MQPATLYHFAMRSVDDQGNQAEWSRTLEQQTGPEGTWWTGFATQGVDGQVSALCGADGSAIVAGGVFSSAGGQEVNGIAHWNGEAWSPLGSGFRAQFGTAGIRAIALFENDLIAAGTFSASGTTIVSNIARWDGTAWRALRGGTDGFISDLVVFDDELVAGGGFFTVDGMEIYSIARWDGDFWRPAGWSTSGFNGIVALEALEDGLIAGGLFSHAGTASANNVARWNGQFWNALGEGLTGSGTAIVSVLAVYEGDLIAAGEFSASGTTGLNNIARWNGNEWAPLGGGVGEPMGGESVYDLAVHNGRLIVGGEFSHAGGSPANNIAAWDGENWASLGSGLDGPVSALISQDGYLHVGGRFQSAGGHPSPNIARWDE